HPLTASVPTGAWQVWPDGNGGFRMTPPAGVGIGNIGLIGGIGMCGAIGFGGGAAGMAGGAVQPVPLTPPLPRAKNPTPDKPKPEKPAVKPPAKDIPKPKDKPATQALRPNTTTPRSR